MVPELVPEEPKQSGRRWPVWPWLVLTVAGVAVTAVAAIVGATAQSTPDEPAAEPTRITVTATEFETSTVIKTVTVSPSAGPRTEFANGLFEVGADVVPGTYRTDGPDGTNSGGCYWTRTTARGELVANGVVNQPDTITVADGERVDAAGCLPWRRVG